MGEVPDAWYFGSRNYQWVEKLLCGGLQPVAAANGQCIETGRKDEPSPVGRDILAQLVKKCGHSGQFADVPICAGHWAGCGFADIGQDAQTLAVVISRKFCEQGRSQWLCQWVSSQIARGRTPFRAQKCWRQYSCHYTYPHSSWRQNYYRRLAPKGAGSENKSRLEQILVPADGVEGAQGHPGRGCCRRSGIPVRLWLLALVLAGNMEMACLAPNGRRPGCGNPKSGSALCLLKKTCWIWSTKTGIGPRGLAGGPPPRLR